MAHAAAGPKNVLILAEGPIMPYAMVQRERIVAAIRPDSAEPLNVYEELIDTVRFDSEEYDRQLVALYKAKYADANLSLVIASSEPALDFALRHRQALFPDVPLIFGAVDERAIRGRTLGPNVTGLFSQIDAQETVAAALSLHAGVRDIIVVGGTSRFDRGFIDVIRPDLRVFDSQASVTYIIDKPLRDVLSAVAALRDDALVLFVSMQLDGEGVARTGPEVLQALRRATIAPIYGMSKNYLGHGIVGGVVLDYERQGTELGQRARRVLDNVQPANLAPTKAENTLTFDWHELKRFGIDEARLPMGAIVVNRELGLWDLHKPTILVTGGVLAGQFVLIGGLLLQRRRRRKAELALRTHQEVLRQSQSRYALATAAGAVGVWDWDLATNDIYVDPKLKSMLGYDDTEIPNRLADWGSHVHPDDLAAVMAQAQPCIDGRADAYEVTHRMVHKDGGIRWFLARGSLIRSEEGTPSRLVGTDMDITDRRQAEEAIRESEAVLRARNREIQNLAGRLIASQEVERARFARDLHDDLSQQLAGVSISLSALRRRADALPDNDLPGEIAALQQRMIGLARNVREVSHNLHPSVLEHAGLVAALGAHCEELQRRETVGVTFSAEGDFETTTTDAALCLYRVAQEGLRNVVTHAGARHVEVRLFRSGNCAELTIADDGSGFDIAQTVNSLKGLGLVSIHERVRLVGGTVSLVTELNQGTQLRVRVPANGSPGDAVESIANDRQRSL